MPAEPAPLPVRWCYGPNRHKDRDHRAGRALHGTSPANLYITANLMRFPFNHPAPAGNKLGPANTIKADSCKHLRFSRVQKRKPLEKSPSLVAAGVEDFSGFASPEMSCCRSLGPRLGLVASEPRAAALSGASLSSFRSLHSRPARFPAHWPNNILVFAWLYPSWRVSSQILAITSSSSLSATEDS